MSTCFGQVKPDSDKALKQAKLARQDSHASLCESGLRNLL
jgi:hypothetical protein